MDVFQVSNSSTISETICECSSPPSNNIATTFYVPPNTIDFGTVFQKFNLTDNAAVFSTVICLIVLYLIICVWAMRQDRRDKEKVGYKCIIRQHIFTQDRTYIEFFDYFLGRICNGNNQKVEF